MNLDLLVTILFILFFVLGPLLQRGGKDKNAPPPRQPGERPRPGPPGETASGRPAQPPEAADPDEDPLARRLEEARRRVLEAMGESVPAGEPRAQRQEPRPAARPGTAGDAPSRQGAPQGTTRQGSTVPPPGRRTVAGPPVQQGTGPSAPPVMDWQEVSRPVGTFIPERPAPQHREVRGAERQGPVVAPPLRTERRSAPSATARLAGERKLALDREGILQGLIWHEILSEPLSKRNSRRRTTSRLRSR